MTSAHAATEAAVRTVDLASVGDGPAGVPEALLAQPTIGWHRRQAGLGPGEISPEARWLLAQALVDEARRRALWDRLDPVLAALHRGLDPLVACARLRQIADDLDRPDAPAVAHTLTQLRHSASPLTALARQATPEGTPT